MIYPGTDIELIPGGGPVTDENKQQYIDGVVNWTLRDGVTLQMEAVRRGFNSVVSVSHLQLFYAHELSNLISGSFTEWAEEDISSYIQADHGYNISSPTIQNLIKLLCEFDPAQQRLFLSFLTGSPRLPVGGFAALHPALTIVKKTVSGHPDMYLPSVMTCVNYLKLPDYTSIAVMRDRLLTAIKEGQNSFHLS